MPIVSVRCPLDGDLLDVQLLLLGDQPMFSLHTSPGFVEHMNARHGGRMDPVTDWPHEEPRA